MSRITRAFLIAAMVAAVCGPAAGDSLLSVADAAICRDVKDRTPVEPGTIFSPDVGALFCFTRIMGAEQETMVTHEWFYNDKRLSLVELKVGSSNWRTWSSKQIDPGWSGDFKVVVKDTEGNVLQSIAFSIQPSGNEVKDE